MGKSKKQKERQRLRSKNARFDVHNRANQMRKKPTKHEAIAANGLVHYGEYVELQKVFWDRYIVDIYLPYRRVVIEIDGPHHKLPENLDKDRLRTESLLKHDGVRGVVRWRNIDVVRKLPDLIRAVQLEYTEEVRSIAKVTGNLYVKLPGSANYTIAKETLEEYLARGGKIVKCG